MEYSFTVSTEDDGSIEKSMEQDSASHIIVTSPNIMNVSNYHIHMIQKSKVKHQKKTKEVRRKEHEFTNQNFFKQCGREVEKEEEEREAKIVYKYQNYPMLDMTKTLYNTFKYPTVLKLLCTAGAAVRVYLTFYFFSVLGVTTGLKLSKWYFLIPWIIAVIGSRLLYLILVLKVGLTSPQNSIQRTLKNIWSRQNIKVHQVFEQITWSKFLECLIKAAIPVELSFIYIRSVYHKRSLIYSTINFIYMSIESVLMYPFVVVYGIYILVTQVEGTDSFWKYTYLTLVFTTIWIGLFTALCGYLVWKGYKLKKERIESY